MRGAIGNLDVAQITLYAFWLFFAGLIFYLRREDRREGYPLENEAAGRLRPRDFLWIPTPKTFRRSDGREVSAPNFRADTRPINATKTEPWPGAPLDAEWRSDGCADVGPWQLRRTRRRTIQDPSMVTTSSFPCAFATNFAVAGGERKPDRLCGQSAPTGRRPEPSGTSGSTEANACFATTRSRSAGAENGSFFRSTFAKVDAKRRSVAVSALLAAQFAGVSVDARSRQGHAARGRQDHRLLRRGHALRDAAARRSRCYEGRQSRKTVAGRHPGR